MICHEFHGSRRWIVLPVLLVIWTGITLPMTEAAPPSSAATAPDLLDRDLDVNPVLAQAVSDPAAFQAHVKRDHARFLKSAARLEKLAESLFRQGSPFDRVAPGEQLTNARQLKAVYRAWYSFLYNLSVMAELAEKYRAGWKDPTSGALRAAFEGYLLGVDANLCRLAIVSRLVEFAQTRRKLETLLNEPQPAFKIPDRAFERVSLAAVSPINLYRLYRFHLSHQDDLERFYNGGLDGVKPRIDVEGRLKAYYDAYRALADRLLSTIAKEPAWYRYVFGKIGHALLDFIFPVQKSLFTWVGDTRVKRRQTRCISPAQLHEMQKHLQPGDIILERQEWFLSNIFLPGFWPHAELYLGTPAQVRRRFDADPAVRAWVQKKGVGSFVDYLAKKYPEPFNVWNSPNPFDGNPQVVLEAISEGVVFSSMEHANHADYCAALRPRLSLLDIAKAIDLAFSYYGAGYDFQFDFATESDLVCTEFVCKSYAPAHGKKGLVIPMREYLGSPVLRADYLVETYAREFGKPDAQLEFVYFLKGDPQGRPAVVSDEPTFRTSYLWKGGLKSKPD